MSFTANANGPRGFDVAKGRGGTPGRSVDARISGTYSTKIYSGQPVTSHTDGTLIVLASAAAAVAGVFDGVEYVDANGDIRFSNYWPAPGAVKSGTTVKARIYPATGVFLVQASAALTQSQVGEYADLVAFVGGSDITGRATAIQLDAANTDATVQSTNVVQILEISPREEGGDEVGTLALVQFIRPQFAANTDAAA